jgi:hypothetical protein
MLGVLVDAFAQAESPHVTISDAADRFNQKACPDLGRPMTNKWVGGFIRNRLRLATTKSRGVYVVPQTERVKVITLARRHGVIIDRATDIAVAA